MGEVDQEIAKRLKQARERRFKTAVDAAEAMGVAYGTYSGHEKGSRGIKPESLKRYAKFFGVSARWLQFDDLETGAASESEALGIKAEISESRLPVKPVQIVGIVCDGLWMDPTLIDDAIFATDAAVPAVYGRWAHLPQTAYVVENDAADLERIYKGDCVVCVPYFEARDAVTDGDLVIVERRSKTGCFERSLKQIVIHGRRAVLHPRSSDDRFKPVPFDFETMTEPDGKAIRIVALVIGTWRPR